MLEIRKLDNIFEAELCFRNYLFLQLEMEEKRLVEELAEVEKEQKAAQDVLKRHEDEKKRLEEEEERYWREYCTHKSLLTSMEDENRRYFDAVTLCNRDKLAKFSML